VCTGAHANTIESTWHHVKAFLMPYNGKGDYIHHLAHYMFSARSRAEKVDEFTKFLHLVATVNLSDWSVIQTLHNRCSAANRLRCVSIHRYMRVATTCTVQCFRRLAYHSGTTAAPHSADSDVVALFFQVHSFIHSFILHSVNPYKVTKNLKDIELVILVMLNHII